MDRDSVLSEAQPGWVYRQFFVAVTKRDEQSLGLDDLSIFHLSKRYCIESYLNGARRGLIQGSTAPL